MSGLLKLVLTPRLCRGMLHNRRVSGCISLQLQPSPQASPDMVQVQGPWKPLKLKHHQVHL